MTRFLLTVHYYQTIQTKTTQPKPVKSLTMTTPTKNILIFGATGLIGQHIANAILANKDKFDRITIFTSSTTISTKANEIESLKSRGAEIIAGELTSASDVKKAYSGIDTVVSCVGRPVIHTQLQLIELADKHPDVKRVGTTVFSSRLPPADFRT